MSIRKSLRLVALLALVALPAGAAGDSAQGFVKERQTELTALVKRGGQDRKIETVFDATLDYGALAQASLRTQWNDRTEAEREEFLAVLKQLVQRAYRRNLDRTVNYEIRFEGEAKDEGRFIVRTVARSRTNAREEPVAIDYVVAHAGGAWKIQDIVTEGSSLVNNYHQQFSRIIKKEGFPELMRRMKGKLKGG